MNNELTIEEAVEEYNKLMPATFWLKLGTPILNSRTDGPLMRPLSLGYCNAILATTLIHHYPGRAYNTNGVQYMVSCFGAAASNFRQLADLLDPKGASSEA